MTLLLFAVSTSVWAGMAPPPNDLCEDAIAVGVPSNTNGTTTNSTPGIAPDCGFGVTTTDGVWYTVVGTGNTMTASTCNETTDYDTELSVYCDDCDDLTCISGIDDDDSQSCVLDGFLSTFSWCSQAGATYRVFVHGDFNGEFNETGDFQLDITDNGQPCQDAIQCLPPTRDINVRVIAICAAPVGVEPHDGGDSEVCLCFGPRSNGFNATAIQRNGKCARSQIGPFCFVDTFVGPLFWKETVTNQTGPTTVIPGEIVRISVPCPEGKMVISCEGRVTVGATDEPAANTSSNIFPTANGLACRHVARTDLPPPPPDPCAQPTAACPCDFDAIAKPMTPSCWPGISPGKNASWLTPTTSQCFLNGQESVLFVEGDVCGVSVNEAKCSGSDQSETGLNPSEVTACQCDLEEYAAALNAVDGLTVTINNVPGGPYDCTPP